MKTVFSPLHNRRTATTELDEIVVPVEVRRRRAVAAAPAQGADERRLVLEPAGGRHAQPSSSICAAISSCSRRTIRDFAW